MLYDYAISFAGPERRLARDVSSRLAARGCKVFFDESFEHEMLGADGVDYLTEVFLHQARQCVALISRRYDERAWTQLERRVSQARELNDPGYLIPVLVDEVRPAWLLPTKIFFDLSARSMTELVDVLVRRVEARGFGPFRRRSELPELYAGDPISISRGSRADEYIAWCTFNHDVPPAATRLFRSPQTGGWSTEPLAIRERKSIIATSQWAVIVPDFSDEPIRLLESSTGRLVRTIQLPRRERWRSITDTHLEGVSLYLGCCGGDVWMVDLMTGTSTCLLPVRSSDPDYAYVDGGATGLVVSVGDTLRVHDRFDGKTLADFAVPEHRLLGCFPADGRIACGWSRVLVIDERTGRTLADQPMAARTPYDSSASADGLLAVVIGSPYGKNLLSLFDVNQGSEVASFESGHVSGWESVVIEPDGSSLAVTIVDGGIVIFDR